MQLFQNGSPNSATFPTKQALSGPAGYANSGPPGVVASTRFDPDIFNTMLAEFVAILTAASLSPDPTNNAQVLAALRVVFGAKAASNAWTGSNNYTASGSTSAQIELSQTGTGGRAWFVSSVAGGSFALFDGTAGATRLSISPAGVVAFPIQPTVPAAVSNNQPVNLGQFVASSSGSLFATTAPNGVIDATFGTTVPIAAGLTTTSVVLPVNFPTFMEQPLVCWDGNTPPLGASVSGIVGGVGVGTTFVAVTTNGTTSGGAGVVIRVRGF